MWPLPISRAGEAPPAKGIYYLVAGSADAAGRCAPVPVRRVAGDDPAGILYIGRADKGSLRTRISGLAKDLLHRRPTDPWGAFESHDAAFEYYVPDVVHRLFPKSGLFVTWEVARDGAEAQAMETKRLVNYRARFGEYPPLNVGGPEYERFWKDEAGQRIPYEQRFGPTVVDRDSPDRTYAPWFEGTAPA